jgi:hypothetical protein
LIELNRLPEVKGTEMERNSAFIIDSLWQAAAVEEVNREFSRQIQMNRGFWYCLALLNKTQLDQSQFYMAVLDSCEKEDGKKENRN